MKYIYIYIVFDVACENIHIPHAMARATFDVGHEQVLGIGSDRNAVISCSKGAP